MAHEWGSFTVQAEGGDSLHRAQRRCFLGWYPNNKRLKRSWCSKPALNPNLKKQRHMGPA